MAIRAASGTGYLSKAPSGFSAAPWTAIGWARTSHVGGSGYNVVGLSNAAVTTYDYFYIETDGSMWAGADTGDAGTAAGVVPADTWVPFLLTRTGSTVLVTRINSSYSASFGSAGTNTVEVITALGISNDSQRDIRGLKLWSATLTDAEVAAEVQQFAPVRTADLRHYAPLASHTDLSDAIAGGSWTNNGATLSTVGDPANVAEEWEGPKVASSATTAGTTSAGGLSCNLPSGITAGDLLMAFAANDTSVSWSASTGWEKIDDGANGTAVQGGTWARIATGSDSLTVTGEANDIAIVVERIVNHGVSNVTTDIIKGTAATGSSNAPNPPNCNPGESKRWLWITHYAADDDDDTALWWPVEGAPVAQVKSATGTSSCQCGVAYRWLEAASYDPSAFALSASEEWRAQTFAIPPYAASPQPDPPTGLDAEGVSASEIEASWDTDVGDDSYDVRFRSTHTLPSVTTQSSSVPWHLDRIYQQAGASPTNEYDYRYTGAGVRVYVLDTGVRATHNQLSGRVASGYNGTDGPDTDEQGHGTSVAGCVAGSLYGVAKGATIVPVKFWRDADLGDSGLEAFFDAYLAAVQWVLLDAVASGVRCVITCSAPPPSGLDPGEAAQIEAAWQDLHDTGIVCVHMAMNGGDVVTNVAPYNMDDVIVVGGSTSSDEYYSDANHGALVDIAAPAHEIPVIGHASDSDTWSSSGTSLSTPMVAGVCALLLEENPTASPARIRELLIGQATPGVLTSVPANTVNLLLYSGATSTEWTTRTDVAEPYTIGDGEPESEYEIAVRRTVDSQTSDWSTGVLAETLADAIELEAGGTASASASGALTTAIAMAGASIVASTSTGSLTTGIKLAGAAASVTLADGALTAQIRLQGAALASAIAAAGLTNAIRLAAVAQAGAQASGDLTTQAAGAALAGDAAAQAIAAGSITAIIRFEAAAAAKAIAEGALSTDISMAGAANIAALASGIVSTQVRMAGVAVASAIASGDLSGAAQFAGDAISQALASGDLATAVRLAGAAIGGASASADLSTTPAGLAASATALAIAEGGLTTAVRLQGAAASVVQATGTLDVAITFEAQAFAQAMAAGALSTQVRFDAAAVAGALAAADLTGGIPVVPPAERTILVRAQSRVIAVVPQERVIPVRAQTRLIPA